MIAENFSGILKNLRGLTALEVFRVYMSKTRRVLNRIFSMSKLKTLAFRPNWQTSEKIRRLHHMGQMQLTKLSWSCKASLLQTVCLTEITHFDIEIWDQNGRDDLVCLSGSMPNLQWLKIRTYNRVLFSPSHLLGGMPKLRGLDLVAVDADPDVYQTLATLPGLIELTIGFYFAQKLPTFATFHSQISLLTNLSFLKICINPCSTPDGLLDGLLGGNLVRLQKLCVPSPDLSDHRAVLFKNLPSLRRFSQSIAFK